MSLVNTRPWKHWKMKWQRLTYHKSPLLMWKNKCRSQTWHLWSGPFNTGFCPCACVQNLLTTLCSVNDNWVLKMLNYLPTQSFTEWWATPRLYSWMTQPLWSFFYSTSTLTADLSSLTLMVDLQQRTLPALSGRQIAPRWWTQWVMFLKTSSWWWLMKS